jgi:hypothetical protein
MNNLTLTKSLLILFIGLQTFLLISPLKAQVGVPVASIHELDGLVQLTPQQTGRKLVARSGSFLGEEDILETGKDGRVSILFRNGSKIRLFEDTKLSIQKALEANIVTRAFEIEIQLHTGSIRANFLPGQQIASIQTPQATIKVDGTVFRMEEKPRSGTTISMTEGKLFVNNGVSSMELFPGQRLSEVKYLDELSTKLENMKTQIFMNLTPETVDLREFTTQKMTLTLQLADLKSSKVVRSAGKVYLESDFYNLRLPSMTSLDNSGFVRVPVRIQPPRVSDKAFDGQIVVRAFLDGARYNLHGEGSLVLNTQGTQPKRKLLIDASQGTAHSIE